MTYHVRIDCSSVYELIGSFMLFVHRKWIRNVDNGMTWVRQAEQMMPSEWDEHARQVKRYSLTDYDMLYAIALEYTGGSHITGYIEHLEQTTDQQWKHVQEQYGLLEISLTRDDCQRYYVPALKCWYEHYISHTLPQWEPILLQDADEKRLLMSKITPEEVVEVATNGIVIRDEKNHIRECILAPMWHYRPMNNTCTFKNKLLVLYAVDEPAEDDCVPSHSLLRMTQALADQERLQLLRFVSQGSRSFTDIQQHLSLSKGTVKHHLAVLRSAGYIRTYWDGDSESIALRREGLSDLSVFLEDYVQVQL
ncbi:ArsR/SmtB family transcription factor [Paenibacillus alvei]|uniref:ArsR/SmtB family transcription factor n=1 Tax=Paenibacillus alvei TaxID=44250 RepID=UPI002282F8D0|nr:winged helix-turn-helix domain-containing protein [Paenibacillus alvei]